MTTRESQPSDALLLMWVLWKLKIAEPITIDLEDAQACHRSFAANGGPALFIHGPGDSVEVRLTSHAAARQLREYHDSQSGSA